MLAPGVNILHWQNLRFRCPPHLKSPTQPLHTKQLAEARFSVLARGSFYISTARHWDQKTAKQRKSFMGGFSTMDNGAALH